MRKLQLREAKTTLSAVVDAAEHGEPTTITKHGRPAAVVVSYEDWTKLKSKIPSFADLLLAVPTLEPADLPEKATGADRSSGRLMSGYLLDTNAISLLAPQSAKDGVFPPHAAFRAWVRAHDEELFLSSVTLAEIQAGVYRLNESALRDGPQIYPIGSTPSWNSTIQERSRSRRERHSRLGGCLIVRSEPVAIPASKTPPSRRLQSFMASRS